MQGNIQNNPWAIGYQEGMIKIIPGFKLLFCGIFNVCVSYSVTRVLTGIRLHAVSENYVPCCGDSRAVIN